MTLSRGQIAGVFVAAALLASELASGQVTVTVAEPVIERRTFDRKNPPSDLPKLAPNEAAITRSNFMVDTRIAGDVVDRQRVGDAFRASLRVQSVRVTTSLSIVIWLPDDAVPKLVKHEEGHRTLAEHYYRDAERVAKAHGERLLGQIVSGTGESYEAAGDAALKQAAEELGQRYLGDIDVPCGKAQDAYDQITAHGTNAVKEARAIEMAIKRAAEQTR